VLAVAERLGFGRLRAERLAAEDWRASYYRFSRHYGYVLFALGG
jgi:hypothetical protein